MTQSTGKRVLRNFGIVLRGRGIAAVFTLLATALMANALDRDTDTLERILAEPRMNGRLDALDAA